MSDAPDLQFEQPHEAAPQKWYSPQTIIPALAMLGTILVVVVAVIPSIIAARAPALAEAEAKAAAEASATASKEAVAVANLLSTEEAAMTSEPVEVTAVSTNAPTTASRATSVPATTAPTEIPQMTAPTNSAATAASQLAPTENPQTNSVATATLAAASNVTLFYDQDAFTILNTSGAHVSLEGVSFQGPDVAWEAVSFGNLVKALPKTRCLRIRDAQAGNRIPPAECGGQIHGFREVAAAAVFWRGESFDVMRDGTVIATCETAAGKCELFVAQ